MMFFDDSMAHRQPQARSASFIGDKWFKNPAQQVACDAGARVSAHDSAKFRVLVAGNAHTERSAVRHRLNRVLEQVAENLCDLVSVCIHRHRLLGKLTAEFNIGVAGSTFDQAHGVAYDLPQILSRSMNSRGAGKVE